MLLPSQIGTIITDNKKTIPVIKNIDSVYQYIHTDFSNQGTGGMQSKLQAAEIAQKSNIECWILNGHENSFLLNAINNKSAFSKIVSADSNI